MPMGPTSPQVPMPEPMGMFSRWNTQVANGPVMAAAKVGGIQMRGFFTMLPIWSIEVPKPCAKSPPQRFSRKLKTANPIICAQQPAVAAPPAMPPKPMARQMAAELMGRVSTMPMTTETTMPISRGCISVAFSMKTPKAVINLPMAGPMAKATITPLMMTTAGVTRISTWVSL